MRCYTTYAMAKMMPWIHFSLAVNLYLLKGIANQILKIALKSSTFKRMQIISSNAKANYLCYMQYICYIICGIYGKASMAVCRSICVAL